MHIPPVFDEERFIRRTVAAHDGDIEEKPHPSLFTNTIGVQLDHERSGRVRPVRNSFVPTFGTQCTNLGRPAMPQPPHRAFRHSSDEGIPFLVRAVRVTRHENGNKEAERSANRWTRALEDGCGHLKAGKVVASTTHLGGC